MNKRILITGAVVLAVFLAVFGIVSQTNKEGENKQTKSKPADTLYQAALSWQAKDDLKKAAKLYQELLKQFPHDVQAADAWFKLGEIYEKEGLWEKAKDAYTTIIAEFAGFKQISEVEKKLWNANIKILFSPIVTKKDIVYVVEPGDTLSKIADEHSTTVDLIMRSNNLQSDLIRPGNRLKLSHAKYSIIVDKSQNSLTLKSDDEILKVYSVATGKSNCTPTGAFKIVEKLKNPDWYKSGEGVVPADDPQNVLGTRWLGLSEPQYGIHGGATKEDLGNQLTNGCVRMTNLDVEELFIILPRATEVTIVD